MAFAGDGEDAAVAGDPVVLEITDTSSAAASGALSLPRPAPVCVSDLARFDPLPSPTVAVRADRHRLIGTSSYFRALLGGSFRSAKTQALERSSCDLASEG
jgi:hypothetical protein